MASSEALERRLERIESAVLPITDGKPELTVRICRHTEGVPGEVHLYYPQPNGYRIECQPSQD